MSLSARPNARALEALASADVVVLAVGSLFTSIAASLVAPGIASQLLSQQQRQLQQPRQRRRVLVLNAGNDRETFGMRARDYLIALARCASSAVSAASAASTTSSASAPSVVTTFVTETVMSTVFSAVEAKVSVDEPKLVTTFTTTYALAVLDESAPVTDAASANTLAVAEWWRGEENPAEVEAAARALATDLFVPLEAGSAPAQQRQWVDDNDLALFAALGVSVTFVPLQSWCNHTTPAECFDPAALLRERATAQDARTDSSAVYADSVVEARYCDRCLAEALLALV